MSKMNQIPYADWPAADQGAWSALFVEGDILDGDGPARNWAPATRRTNQKHYAQWLGWLETKDMLLPLAPGQLPWQRTTCEAVTAYGRALREGRSARTVASSLIGLKCVLIRMAPDQDWRWLRDLTNKLDAWADANTVKKDTFPITAPDIYARCLSVLDGLMAKPLTRPTERNTCRNTLIIALLTACPIRMRNLHMIEIGTHLVEVGKKWRLLFKSHETKTGTPLSYILPDSLVPAVGHYINHIRPRYRGSERTARLWIGLKQAPMSYEAIYGAVTARTKAQFGTSLSPHDFRSLAATFLSETSVSDSLRARALLGHCSESTTQDHYIRANSIEASRKTAATLREIRDG